MAILNIDPLETMDTRECSRRTQRPVESLIKDRKYRRGIPYLKWGASVRYRAVDVARWLEEQTVDPAEQQGGSRGRPAPAAVQNTGVAIPPHLRGRGMRGFN